MPKSKHRKNANGKRVVHKKKFTYSTIWLPEEQINAIKKYCVTPLVEFNWTTGEHNGREN